MTKDSPIVFIDSGIGGLPYVEATRALLPNENIIYVADSKNFPYGEKPIEIINNIVINLSDKLIRSFDPKLIVLACNTASVVALSSLRQKFIVSFVGVVPALKTAAKISKYKRIGLLATNRTVQDKYIDNLIINFASDCTVFRYPASEIVDFVENRFFDSTQNQKLEVANNLIKIFKNDGIDALVLGCTHFIYLEKLLNEQLQHNIEIIDSRAGVANQIKRLIEEEDDLLNNKNTLNSFYHTGIEKNNYPEFSKRFGLQYKGKTPE